MEKNNGNNFNYRSDYRVIRSGIFYRYTAGQHDRQGAVMSKEEKLKLAKALGALNAVQSMLKCDVNNRVTKEALAEAVDIIEEVIHGETDASK